MNNIIHTKLAKTFKIMPFFKLTILFFSLMSATPLEEDWITPPAIGAGDITTLVDNPSSFDIEFYVRMTGPSQRVGVECFFFKMKMAQITNFLLA